MRRLVAVFASLLFFCGGMLALVWLGHYYFMTYVSSKDRLWLEEPASQVLPLGTEVVFNLRGSGFNKETSARLFMNVSSSQAVIGSIPLAGVYNESLLSGDFLYLAGSHNGLQVLDVKEPAQPKRLKGYLPGRSIIDIHRSGMYLYLSCGKLGVSIMQIQTNGSLHHIADIAVKSGARSCHVSSGTLYVAAGKKGVQIYDIQQPQQARLVQVLRPDSFASALVVSGATLYLPVVGNQIEIYQLAEQQLPVLKGVLRLSEAPNDLISHQHHLYVATKSGVSSYDITNSSHPELLHQWTDFGAAKKLFAGLEHVYISDNFSGLRVVGSELDEYPGYVNLNIDPRTVSETSSYLYVAGSDRGLLIVDKHLLLPRQVIRRFNTPGSTRDIFINNNWLYIAAGRDGVLLQDLESEGAPATTLSLRRGESFTVHRERLYVAQADMGIEVFDISDPGHPRIVAFWPELRAWRLAVSANYLFLTKGISGIELIDISDIQHPVSRDLLPDIHPLDVTVAGGLIYIASKNQGLLIYEVTGDKKLNLVSQLQTPFPMNQFDLAVDVQVEDDIAYVANGRSGLLLVDVRKPNAPVILSSTAIPGIAKAVKVVGKKAIITSHHGGINVVDIEDPEKPVLLISIAMPGLSKGLQVAGDLIYVAQRAMGVAVVPVPAEADTIRILSDEEMEVTLSAPEFSGSYSLQINNQRESAVSDGAVIYQ